MKHTIMLSSTVLGKMVVLSFVVGSLLSMIDGASCFNPHRRNVVISTPIILRVVTKEKVTRWGLFATPSASTTVSDSTPKKDVSTISKTEDVIPSSSTDIVICGGGPAGLLSAIMLTQKFPQNKIRVYDRLPAPYSPTDPTVWNDYAKFYLIGLGGRGQTALARFGVWEHVENVCCAVVGRKDWAPGSEEGVERIFEGRKFKTQVLPRDKLVAVLYQYIQDNYSGGQIEFHHGYEVVPVTFGDDNDTTDRRAVVDIIQCQGQSDTDIQCSTDPVERVSTNLLIAADGTSRTVANAMEELDRQKRDGMLPLRRIFAGKGFSVTRYPDDNQRVYKTIPMKLPADWRPDLNYSARSKDGGMNIDALPANREGNYCGVLLLRKDDVMAKPDVDPNTLREFLNKKLPQFSAIVDDDVVAQVAKKPPSFLPAFRFVSPRLNQGDTTILLGDCAHTVKPYFGLGANSALEDVSILADCIDETDSMKEAVHEFSRRRAKDSETLVRISRKLDRPGTLGIITFIIPIILDSIFNKMSPKLFAPNIISMLQRDDLTFNQVARRKTVDRIAQVSILGTLLTGITLGTAFLMSSIAKALGRRTSTVAMTFVGAVLVCGFLKKSWSSVLNPEMAPADVLAKMKAKITLKEKFSKTK